MSQTIQGNKQIMFILVCLDACLELKHTQMGTLKYRHWVIDNRMTPINDGTCKASGLIFHWKELCQFQS